MQYIMVDVELINNQNINNDELIAYSLLCDRMRSSKRSRSFFDAKFNDYYVIYTIEEMAKKLKVSARTVNNIFKKLVKLGFLTKKKQFSKADKIFLPKFIDPIQTSTQNLKTQDLQHVNAKTAAPQTQNVQSNQSDLNQINKSEIYTVNTNEPEKNNSAAIKKWKHSVCDKIKIKPIIVDRILKFTNNDLNRAHKIIGVILKAKNKVAKQTNLLNSPVAKFESNTNLGTKLALQLTHVFSYLPANLEEQCKYLMAAMKTYFLEAFGVKKDELITPVAESQKKKRVIPVPKWMSEGTREFRAPSKEKKERVLALLAKFK